MRELSIFVDESGDFGPYAKHSPYYIISMVFHDQDIDINDDIKRLDESLDNLGYSKHTIHTEPLIRREGSYYLIPLYNKSQSTSVPLDIDSKKVIKRNAAAMLVEWVYGN